MSAIPPGFTLSHYRLTLRPCEAIRLPRLNKGIALRGAFGSAFRALVSVDRSAQCSQCPMQQTCVYGIIFLPCVPEGAERLRLNRDIPRPFVIKPPLDYQETYVIMELCGRGIQINFIHGSGKPYAKIIAPSLLATIHARREQIRAMDDSRGLRFAITVVTGKLANQRKLLLYFNKYMKGTALDRLMEKQAREIKGERI